MKVGIPRAGMYYRYKTLWLSFFKHLGIETIISPETNKAILDAGSKLMVDESCLASKIYMGHVNYLMDRCDCIFIPWISNFGSYGINCTRFRAYNAITANIFRDRHPHLLAYAIDYSGTQDMVNAASEEEAFVSMADELGKPKDKVLLAYREAKAEYDKELRDKLRAQEELCKKPGKKVLLVGHDYNIHDKYIGEPIIKEFNELGVQCLDANVVDRDQAQIDFHQFTDDTLPWIISRELLGGIVKYKDSVDGIALITGFPCGPDSIVNDLIQRKVKDKPLLYLLLDASDALAGIETRIESFVDIIEFNENGGQNNG